VTLRYSLRWWSRILGKSDTDPRSVGYPSVLPIPLLSGASPAASTNHGRGFYRRPHHQVTHGLFLRGLPLVTREASNTGCRTGEGNSRCASRQPARSYPAGFAQDDRPCWIP
jgi:hypothetical protein